MINGYIPLNIVDAMMEERRREIEKMRYGSPVRPKRQPRKALGQLLVRLGRRIEGVRPAPVPQVS